MRCAEFAPARDGSLTQYINAYIAGRVVRLCKAIQVLSVSGQIRSRRRIDMACNAAITKIAALESAPDRPIEDVEDQRGLRISIEVYVRNTQHQYASPPPHILRCVRSFATTTTHVAF